MATTEERRSISLTKEDLRQLEYLMSLFGESRTGVLRRALNELYLRILAREDKQKKSKSSHNLV